VSGHEFVSRAVNNAERLSDGACITNVYTPARNVDVVDQLVSTDKHTCALMYDCSLPR